MADILSTSKAAGGGGVKGGWWHTKKEKKRRKKWVLGNLYKAALINSPLLRGNTHKGRRLALK